MQSTISQLQTIINSFPQFSFKDGEIFCWQPESNTIIYNPKDKECLMLLLHEIGHASLGHSQHTSDILLLKMENQAWSKASELAFNFNLKIDQNLIDTYVDSYRDWLHKRSICPKCSAIGLQNNPNSYTCMACSTKWRVNSAKTKALRRYILN